jgi:hypothetical protein
MKTDTITLTLNPKVYYKTSPEVVIQQPLIQLHVTTMQIAPQEYVIPPVMPLLKYINIYCFKDLKYSFTCSLFKNGVSSTITIQKVRR